MCTKLWFKASIFWVYKSILVSEYLDTILFHFVSIAFWLDSLLTSCGVLAWFTFVWSVNDIGLLCRSSLWHNERSATRDLWQGRQCASPTGDLLKIWHVRCISNPLWSSFQGFGGADKFETRLLIPSKMGGAVIGKKGCNIQQLRSDYNATIRCDHL